MDLETTEAGIEYERFIMNAYQLETPSYKFGANRRYYYLLYYIELGFDLRETGYERQFLTVRNYIQTALLFLNDQEIHEYEKTSIARLLLQLEDIYEETSLRLLIKKALQLSYRFSQQNSHA